MRFSHTDIAQGTLETFSVNVVEGCDWHNWDIQTQGTPPSLWLLIVERNGYEIQREECAREQQALDLYTATVTEYMEGQIS